MSESMSEPSGAEPAYAPYLRFARNVLIVDLVMGVAVFVLSWWQGWTSVEESTTAIFGAGAVLFGLAALPLVAPALEGVNRGHGPGGWYEPEVLQQARAEAFKDAHSPMRAGFTLILLAAGMILIGYAGVVSALFLS